MLNILHRPNFNMYVEDLHLICMLMISNATLLPIKKLRWISLKKYYQLYSLYCMCFLYMVFRQLFHERNKMFPKNRHVKIVGAHWISYDIWCVICCVILFGAIEVPDIIIVWVHRVWTCYFLLGAGAMFKFFSIGRRGGAGHRSRYCCVPQSHYFRYGAGA